MPFEAVNTVTNTSTTPAVDVFVLPVQNELLLKNSEEGKLNKKGIYINPNVLLAHLMILMKKKRMMLQKK